ncbi:hypothetical protein INT45_001224 [Circinella minor]|uniref:C2H2-type domain-containing protein n=1 Tax=Circinella minor TaxID=1195481 RepID=A0A8H7VHU2_9FUNG|nr:hypothetical protein INT45_001224 [Circinella minor]
MYYRQQSSLLLQEKEVWPMNPTAEEWFLSHSSILTSSSTMINSYHPINNEPEQQQQRPSPTPSSSSSSSNSSNSLLFDFPTTKTKMLIKPKGIRCATCKRRFHSEGNLMNHHQLYQH